MTPRRPEIIRLTPLGQLVRLPAMLVALALVMLYVALHGRAPLSVLFADTSALSVLVGAYLLSIPAHEGLHVLGFRWLGQAPAGSTRVRWRGLSAYTHCGVPVRASAYRAAVALPGVVLGLLPFGTGLLTGSTAISLYGAMLTASALGDARVLLALRNVPSDATVHFVPEYRGYEIVRNAA